MRGAKLLVAAALVAVACAAAATAAPGGSGPPKVHPRISDLKYIRCQVCELLAKNAWKQAKELLKTATPSNKVDEMILIEKMEKITTAWRPEGEWIAKTDLVEEGSKLIVKEMDRVGNCGVECKTVEKAAEQIMGEHDTDIAEVLFTAKRNRAQFTNWLCYELTDTCKVKPPPLPEDREPGPAFQPMKDGDQNIERMLGEMQDKGMRGSLYSREDLMARYGMQEGDKDEEEDGEEGEEKAGKWKDPDMDGTSARRANGPPGGPIPWHHIGGGKPYRTTVTERLVDGAKGAAAAAGQGLKAAADKARGLWDRVTGRQQQEAKEEL